MTFKTLRTYGMAKELYDSIKPIRGRADDVRPLDDRRRTHEVIRKVHVRHEETGLMVEAYACRLHLTDVVTFFPDESITINTDGWNTMSTMQFINWVSPVRVSVGRGNTWLIDNQGKYHPFHNTIRVDAYNSVINPKPFMRKVVDRQRSAEIRKAIKPFTDFCTTMLKMSDGWLRYSTLAEVGMDETVRWATGCARDADNALFAMETKGEEHYMRMMIAVLCGQNAIKPTHTEVTGMRTPDGWVAYDRRYNVNDFKARINTIIYRTHDVWTTEPCEPTTCIIDKVII
jgi:hypothetical protein